MDNGNKMTEKKVPRPTMLRMIQLIRLLEQFERPEETNGSAPDFITSAQIAGLGSWTDDTVRRDIHRLGIKCAGHSGYNISGLREALRAELGIGTEERICCIVGLGRLGEALIEYEGFRHSSFRIAAGFDTNVNRTETLRSPFPLYPASRMEAVIARETIEFALLAVPEHAAQQTAERLCACGIRGIVNYTSAILNVPDGIAVENLSVIGALRNMSIRRT